MPVVSMSRHTWFRSPAFWLALLFVLYSLLGWLVVPELLRDQATRHLKQIANWDVKIGTVQFNPYALSLEVSDLTAADAKAEKQLGFERLYVNFDALASLAGPLSFSEIELEAPHVNITLDAQGITNFQRAFASPDQASEPATDDVVALAFDSIVLNRGLVELNDLSGSEAFHLSLQPLSLNLVEFATHNNDGGDYSLDISLGNDQRLHWQGKIGMAPLSSSGQLTLEQLQLTTFWHYLRPLSPFKLSRGKLDLSGHYVFDARDGKAELNIEQGTAKLNELALAAKDGTADFMTLGQLNIAPIRFDLGKRHAEMGVIELNALQATVIRDQDGLLPILEALKAKSGDASPNAATQTPPPADGRDPVTWSVAEVKLTQGEVIWQDQSIDPELSMRFQDIDASLTGLTQDLSRPLPWAGQATLGETRLNLSGKLVPQPMRADGEFTFEDLPLATLQPYISAYSQARVQSGTASFSGSYSIQKDDERLRGHINTELSLHSLALGENDEEPPLLGFEKLVISPLEVTLAPQRITMGTLTLEKPFGDVALNEAGQLNLAALATPVSAQNTDSESESSAQDAPMAIVLKRFDLLGGQLSVSDSRQKPPFSARLTEINGYIDDLSSAPDQLASLTLDSKLDSQGRVHVTGTVNPLSVETQAKLKIDLKNVDLTPTSPYAVRYLGYPITKGKLGLDIDYLREGASLKTSNKAVLNQVTLGSYVKGPDAIDLPLPLALALLRDGEGNIALDLPIKGNIDDPSFRIGSIMMNALTNVLTKTVTSPFSVLGSLIGDSSKDMSSIAFTAGKADLDPAQYEQLSALAMALNKRPALTLEVKGVADQVVDKRAMQYRKLEKRLGKEREKTREELIHRWLSVEQAKALDDISDDDDRLAQTDTALRNAIPVTPLEFNSLASQRGQNLVAWLVSEGNIAEDRLFIVTPAITDAGASDSTSVASEFGLGAR